MENFELLNPFFESLISGCILLAVWLVKRTVDNNHTAHSKMMDRLENMASSHSELMLKVAGHDSTLAEHGVRIEKVEDEVEQLKGSNH